MSGPANDRAAEAANTGDLKSYVPAAAVLYGLDALIGSASFGLDPGKLVGTGAAGVAARIAVAEPMIRLSILSEATYQVVEIFLAIQLYRMFRPVSGILARQMFALALVPVPIMFVNLLTETGALSVSLDTSLSGSFAPDQRDALAALMIRMHGQGVAIAGIFWGLWLLPLGLLIMRSRFVPKLLGVLELAGGLGWMLGCLSTLVMPGLFSAWAVESCSRIAAALEVGELPFIVWLVLKSAHMALRGNWQVGRQAIRAISTQP